MRATPLAVRAALWPDDPKETSEFLDLTAVLFRASAAAWAAARFPARLNELRAPITAAGLAAQSASSHCSARAAASALFGADNYANAFSANSTLAAAASNSALAAVKADAAPFAASFAAVAARCAAKVGGAHCGAVAAETMWAEIRSDVDAYESFGAGPLTDLALWSERAPQWAIDAWAALKAILPEREDWGVWVDWYETRLRGEASDETHELVFATAPSHIWDRGRTTANAWIRRHLS